MQPETDAGHERRNGEVLQWRITLNKSGCDVRSGMLQEEKGALTVLKNQDGALFLEEDWIKRVEILNFRKK